MEETLRNLWAEPGVKAAVIVVGSIVAASLTEFIIRRTLVVLVRKTETDLDDIVVEAIRRPVFLSVLLIGLSWASDYLSMPRGMPRIVDSALETVGVLVWTSAAYRIGVAVLGALSRRGSGTAIIQARTLPVFEMLVKVTVIGAALYFTFLAWRIDLTAWLASAGIIGIAIGFAAKDTLANLFSGIFIVADAPYKVGDFIVLDGDLRGQVTKIGMRSTRILTRDDVEITVPNAVIGNSKIVNETGGPDIKQRVGVAVDAAYGSDIDQVREVLLRCPDGIAHVASHPGPQVRFREFGGSGLSFEILVWLENPAAREAVLDQLHCNVYKSFGAAGIEIPYSKHDVYIKEMPAPPKPKSRSTTKAS